MAFTYSDKIANILKLGEVREKYAKAPFSEFTSVLDTDVNLTSYATKTGSFSNFDSPSPTGGKSIYLAGGWFNELQKEMLLGANYVLSVNPTVGHVHVPILHQYHDATEDNDLEGIFGGYEWSNETFKADVTAMDLADLGVFLYDAKNPDDGTAFEIGYMYANHKPTILVTKDIEPKDANLNLMIAKSMTVYMDSYETLASYDFNEIMPEPFKGGIF